MQPTLPNFLPDQTVQHPRYDIGTVLIDNGQTVVVRFTSSIQECLKRDLTRVRNLQERITSPTWDVPLEVIARVQAGAICSVNDTWGVYSPSRMELLPHQLWVCRQVASQWPTRWLVADDVGLGKTVEAGMILSALLARQNIRRILILCPASLVLQWQHRMHTMFGINFSQYLPEADTPRTNFWRIHSQVVASLQTLRMDQKGRRERLLDTEPWDLVLVDEAHHLNADEQSGPTLGYRLLKDLQAHDMIHSMIFFTGTPHRGKDFGFFALLQLLRPEWFDSKRTLKEQMAFLPQVMLRNNKGNVTDLRGERLFHTPLVYTDTYSYSREEGYFYQKLTEFIATGKAYASNLSQTHGRAVMLVLIAMQKLASSSVAAVRRALASRLERIRSRAVDNERTTKLLEQYKEIEYWNDQDQASQLEENLAARAFSLRLMRQEEEAIEDLIQAADAVQSETRIERLVEIVRSRFLDKSILFFTEYKATQALLLSALYRNFGEHCATFINGDESLDDVILPSGLKTNLAVRREAAASHFNAGQVRFLVSTEAGGEGIDLQQSCHTLIHVDLPWNPMRMHQRVGRLNRYGQTRQVEVLMLLNPDTVESRIWDKLNEKLARISAALGQVMEEPEDMLQLVLGMTSPSLFRELYEEAASVSPERFSEWFDTRTARIGGQDAVETVREMLGNVSRFDFQQMSEIIPRTDIPDLKPFFETMLALNGRRVREDAETLSFLTPEVWRKAFGMRSEYQNLSFRRSSIPAQDLSGLLGVGHRVMDQALKQAQGYDATVASVDSDLLSHPLVVFRVRDRVTADQSYHRVLVFGVEIYAEDIACHILTDWELLKLLNNLQSRKLSLSRETLKPMSDDRIKRYLTAAQENLEARLVQIDHRFQYPSIEVMAILISTRN